jgi:PAS domain-containing protein
MTPSIVEQQQQHAAIIEGVTAQFREILDGSPQGMYIYLDDQHKVCNERFASMLGYPSAAAWDQHGAFTEQYIDPQSQQTLVHTYRHAMEQQAAATIDVTWKTREGAAVPSSVILVPVAYEGELLALHFITPRQ